MKISRYYRTFLRRNLNKKNQRLLKNKNFTILCNNCVGGVILHELGERFNSPTINLFFHADDFIKFLTNMDYYLHQDLFEIESDYTYPVGVLGDITIYFRHYSSFDEAKKIWVKRSLRINKDNLYIILVQRDGCTSQIVEKFDKLPYKNKVALVSKPMPKIKCAYFIPDSEQSNDEVLDLCKYKNKFTGKRWIDDFDYVEFLNRK